VGDPREGDLRLYIWLWEGNCGLVRGGVIRMEKRFPAWRHRWQIAWFQEEDPRNERFRQVERWDVDGIIM
jgi:hypothetical protein